MGNRKREQRKYTPGSRAERSRNKAVEHYKMGGTLEGAHALTGTPTSTLHDFIKRHNIQRSASGVSNVEESQPMEGHSVRRDRNGQSDDSEFNDINTTEETVAFEDIPAGSCVEESQPMEGHSIRRDRNGQSDDSEFNDINTTEETVAFEDISVIDLGPFNVNNDDFDEILAMDASTTREFIQGLFVNDSIGRDMDAELIDLNEYQSDELQQAETHFTGCCSSMINNPDNI